MHILVFGIIELTTKTIIMYSVTDCKATSLLPLIQKHAKLVQLSLAMVGQHTVHKMNSDTAISQFFINILFGRTTRIWTLEKLYKLTQTQQQSAWKLAKDYFRYVFTLI